MAAVKCKNCKSLVSSNDELCPHCGSKVELEVQCPKCGNKDCTFRNEGQIVYSCEKCNFHFTVKDGITEEYIPPQPKNFNPITAFISMWKNALNFKGRARRSEYWYGMLWFYLLEIAYIIFTIFGVVNDTCAIISLALTAILLISILPILALTVRRLHDTGKSFAFLLLGLIPTVGSILMLIFMILNSEIGGNKYGPNPKGEN